MVGSLKVVAIAPGSAAIAGGFVLVPLASLMAVWRSCRGRPGGPGDFRAWLACREMLARRGRIGLDRAPIYDEAELAGLLGISPRRARASVRRLVAAGLLRWSELVIEFPEPPASDAGPAGEVLADSIGSGRGTLAIPRRLIRFLARGARPALLATTLGALLRCLSRRRAGFDGRGRLKASWVARAFGVDPRAVKAARAELVALGWLTPEASGQAAMNRWGRPYQIDLAWARPGPPAGAEPPPPRPRSSAGSPPPDLDQDPLSGRKKNQDPASGGPAGFEYGWMDACKDRTPKNMESARPLAERPSLPTTRWSAPPRLEDVRPEDLADADRLMELHRQAAARGLVGMSEADRLKFAAAAEHARGVGRRNPCGLFARIVAKGWWSFATSGEEERAARRLRERGRGITPRVESPPLVADQGPSPGLRPSSVGSVLERLGVGVEAGVRGGEAGHERAVAIPRRRVGGRRWGGDGLIPEERRGPDPSAEAAMLARWGRLMGGG